MAGNRGKRIVEMALENPYDDEDVSNNSDISDQDMKRKGSTRKISNKKRRFLKTCSDGNEMTKIPKMNANSMNQPGPSMFGSEFDLTKDKENSISVPSFISQLQLSEPIEEEFHGSHPTFSQPLQYSETNKDIQQELDEFFEVEIGQPSRKNPVGNHQVFDYADAGLSPNDAATL
ncbi:hypothetical protein HHI36_013399 [Cryptolaemus montrouzieri]|uniref:Uncharacterized protein n=1 Tax=Cryptolaemus montrouzieri TaxID=559131 RepID=A0ABD2NHP4_9CUCU